MDELNFETVAIRSVKSAFALVGRTLFIQIIGGIVALLILPIYLDAADYGIFFIVSAIVVFFTYFQDIGLAAALIQKREEPTVEELRSIFTLQQLLVIIPVMIAIAFSGQLASIYKLDSEGQILLIALLVSFVFSSLRTIPTVIMERQINFGKLVVPQIVEMIVYNIALVVCAVAGLGVTTFTVAILGRSIVGLAVTYMVQSWPIGFSFNFRKIKHLINFGIPFQANSILALVKDDLLVLYVGTILPLTQVGYIAFAQKWAFMPLRLIMDNVIKITFPSYSRLQHDTAALKLAVEKSLFLVTFLVFPVAVAVIMYSHYLIEFFPRYSKWEPALLSLTFFAFSTLISSISTPLTNLLNAIGKVRITLMFMIMWTVLTWILTPLLIFRYGFNGFAMASFAVSLSSVVVFVVVRKYVKYSFINPIIKQLIAAIVMGVGIYLIQDFVTSFIFLIIDMILAGLLYIGVIYLLNREEFIKTSKFIIISIRRKA